MKTRNIRRTLAAGLAGTLLVLTACDDGLIRSGDVSWFNDPPNVLLVAGGKLVVVRFNKFGRPTPVVTELNTFPVLNASLSPLPPLASGVRNAGPRPGFGGFGGGDPFVDPDPDEHEFDPDNWPDPEDDFPLPDSPLPLPDFPDEDPFDGLPDPPPFPDDVDVTNLGDGSMSTSSTVSANASGTNDEIRAAQANGRSATVARVAIGARPIGMKISPDKKRTYVAYALGIAVIDRATRSVVDRITLPPEARPHSLAVSLDNKRLYVTSYLSTAAQVYVVDLASKSVIASIPVGGFPSGIAVTPDGTQVWATSLSSGNVTVIDTLTSTRVLVISGISAAWGVRFNPTGTRAYVTSSENVGGS
ncbi:MAG: hypothetical protein ABI822_32395, partial [Bryobacteraceae bacterium]